MQTDTVGMLLEEVQCLTNENSFIHKNGHHNDIGIFVLVML